MNLLNIINAFKDNNLNDDDYYILYLVQNERWNDVLIYKDKFDKLIKNKHIIRKNGTLVLNLPDEINIDDSFINEYRQFWHYSNTGVKGKMGNVKSCKERVIKFLIDYQITKEDLLELAAYYTNNYNTVSGFLQQADYFLYKEKTVDGKKVTESRAASLLNEYEDFTINSDVL